MIPTLGKKSTGVVLEEEERIVHLRQDRGAIPQCQSLFVEMYIPVSWLGIVKDDFEEV
jgi:hypothetical protein